MLTVFVLSGSLLFASSTVFATVQPDGHPAAYANRNRRRGAPRPSEKTYLASADKAIATLSSELSKPNPRPGDVAQHFTDIVTHASQVDTLAAFQLQDGKVLRAKVQALKELRQAAGQGAALCRGGGSLKDVQAALAAVKTARAGYGGAGK